MIFVRYLRQALLLWRKRRVQVALSGLGIVMGVAGLTAAHALGSGARQEFERGSQFLGASVLHVLAAEGAPVHSRLDTAWLERLRKLFGEHLSGLAPVVRQELAAQGQQAAERIRTVGTSAAYEDMYGLRVDQGRFLSWLDNGQRQRVCVLGRQAAKRLYPTVWPLGERLRLGRDWYTVIGVLKATPVPNVELGGYTVPEVDEAVFVPHFALASASQGRAYVTEVILRFADEDHMSSAVGVIERSIATLREPRPAVIVPVQLLRQKQHAHQTLQLVLAGVSALVLLIGGVGVGNVMLVNVVSRRSEIGLRRAIGASGLDIAEQFLTESVLICLTGGLAGVAAGWVSSRVIAAWLGWPMAFSPQAALLGLGVAAVIGVLAGTSPAVKAASVAPMQALRSP